MRTIRFLAVLAALPVALAACAAKQEDGPRPVTASATVERPSKDPIADWQNVISSEDLERLQKVDQAWTEALAQARRAGYGKAIEAEGALLDPAAALPRAAPPPGPYECRVIKVGHPVGQRKGLDFIAYKSFVCHVEAEADRLWIVKQTGSQRPAGRIWPDKDNRQVFLGAMVLGDEKEPPAYGDDPERDLAGYVERVDAFRWRIVIPYPRYESRLDVFELIPLTPVARRSQGTPRG